MQTHDLDPSAVPGADLSAYEQPSTDIVELYRNVLDALGVQVDEVEAIARAFDSVRQIRRCSAPMPEHNDDHQLCDYFNQRFKSMIR